MSIAPVPAGIAVVGVAVLVVLLRSWGWTREDFTRRPDPLVDEAPVRRIQRGQARQLLVMSAVCVALATISGQHVGYLIAAGGIAMATFILYWVRRRS